MVEKKKSVSAYRRYFFSRLMITDSSAIRNIVRILCEMDCGSRIVAVQIWSSGMQENAVHHEEAVSVMIS